MLVGVSLSDARTRLVRPWWRRGAPRRALVRTLHATWMCRSIRPPASRRKVGHLKLKSSSCSTWMCSGGLCTGSDADGRVNQFVSEAGTAHAVRSETDACDEPSMRARTVLGACRFPSPCVCLPAFRPAGLQQQACWLRDRFYVVGCCC